MKEVMEKCSICGRELDNNLDPLSENCGGDCWGCIGEIEAEGGYELSLEQVRKEFLQGHRPDWVPAPIVKISIKDKGFFNLSTNLKIILEDQIGKPWEGKFVSVKIVLKTRDGMTEKQVLDRYTKSTDHFGEVRLVISTMRFNLGRQWIDIGYDNRTWSFPAMQLMCKEDK